MGEKEKGGKEREEKVRVRELYPRNRDILISNFNSKLSATTSFLNLLLKLRYTQYTCMLSISLLIGTLKGVFLRPTFRH